MKTYIFQADYLHALARRMFEASGAPSEIAHIVAQILVNANLAGHDSHGVLRLPVYLKKVSEKTMDPAAEPTLVREGKTTLVLDGNLGPGHLTAYRALRMAIEKARESETCSVSFTRIEHIGRLGEYAEIAARAGCVGLTMVGRGRAGSGIVLPFGGLEGGLSTNPIAVGVPTGDARPFVLDFATSVVAEGKLQVARSKGISVAEGTIVDKDGRPTTDPLDFYDGGFLLPFGGHKGYALSLMNCLFSGLAGGLGVDGLFSGAFLQVIDVGAFTDLAAYEAGVRAFLDRMKTTPPAPGHGEVLVPGDFEYRNRMHRLVHGVEIPETIHGQLAEWAGRLGVPMDGAIVEPEDTARYARDSHPTFDVAAGGAG